jgi:hypothetical protein
MKLSESGARPRDRVELLTIVGLMIAAGYSILGAIAFFLDHSANTDFAAFHQSALNWRHGDPPYVSTTGRFNLNPPVMLLVFVAFTFWPVDVAAWPWIGLQVLGLLILTELVLTSTVSDRRDRRLARLVILAVVAPTFAVAHLLTEGQWVIWLAILVTIAWRLSDRGFDRSAAGLIGIVIALKPFTWWFWLALRHPLRPRTLLPVAGGALMTIVASLVMGADLFAAWIRAGATESITYWSNVSLPAHLSRTFGWSWWTAAAAVAPAFLILMRFAPSRWFLASLASVLASPVGWLYYLPLGLGPAVARVAGEGRLSIGMFVGWLLLLSFWPFIVSLNASAWLMSGGLVFWIGEAMRESGLRERRIAERESAPV